MAHVYDEVRDDDDDPHAVFKYLTPARDRKSRWRRSAAAGGEAEIVSPSSRIVADTSTGSVLPNSQPICEVSDDSILGTSQVIEDVTASRIDDGFLQSPGSLSTPGEPHEADCGSSSVPVPLDAIIHADVQRRAYLITYAHANLQKFPTRDSFSAEVLRAFHGGKSANNFLVTEWCCTLEPHRVVEGTFHYHMAVHLAKPKRWINVKQRIADRCGVVVNFSSEGLGYAWAARYAVKSDSHPIFSPLHKDYSKIGGNKQSIAAFSSHSKKAQRKRNETGCGAKRNASSLDTSCTSDSATPKTRAGGKGLGSKRVQVFPSMGR